MRSFAGEGDLQIPTGQELAQGIAQERQRAAYNNPIQAIPSASVRNRVMSGNLEMVKDPRTGQTLYREAGLGGRDRRIYDGEGHRLNWDERGIESAGLLDPIDWLMGGPAGRQAVKLFGMAFNALRGKVGGLLGTEAAEFASRAGAGLVEGVLRGPGDDLLREAGSLSREALLRRANLGLRVDKAVADQKLWQLSQKTQANGRL